MECTIQRVILFSASLITYPSIYRTVFRFCFFNRLYKLFFYNCIFYKIHLAPGTRAPKLSRHRRQYTLGWIIHVLFRFYRVGRPLNTYNNLLFTETVDNNYYCCVLFFIFFDKRFFNIITRELVLISFLNVYIVQPSYRIIIIIIGITSYV